RQARGGRTPGKLPRLLVDGVHEEFSCSGHRVQRRREDKDGNGQRPVGGTVTERALSVQQQGLNYVSGGLWRSQVVRSCSSPGSDGDVTARVGNPEDSSSSRSGIDKLRDGGLHARLPAHKFNQVVDDQR